MVSGYRNHGAFDADWNYAKSLRFKIDREM
jgi:hypothetical protein